jgi:hypothetical protein
VLGEAVRDRERRGRSAQQQITDIERHAYDEVSSVHLSSDQPALALPSGAGVTSGSAYTLEGHRQLVERRKVHGSPPHQIYNRNGEGCSLSTLNVYRAPGLAARPHTCPTITGRDRTTLRAARCFAYVAGRRAAGSEQVT